MYLDDIIIFSRNLEEHEVHVQMIKNRLKEAGLILNDEKCEYTKKEITILRHKISGDGIKPLESRILAIKSLKLPSSKKQLQSYLGMINYCRKFIPNLSIMCKLLYNIFRSEISNKCMMEQLGSEEIQKVFENLKIAMPEITLLTISDRTKQFILTTDASKVGISAILSQLQNNKEKIISFFSSVHNDAQSRYSTTDQELLALISAVKHFRHYLLGQKFILRTDHKALIYMMKTKDESTRIYRWSLLLQEYDFELQHIRGVNNFTDYLSRACNLEIQESKTQIVKRITSEEDIVKILKAYQQETGHGSSEVMLYLLRQKFIWKGMHKSCKEFTRMRQICEKDKVGRRR